MNEFLKKLLAIVATLFIVSLFATIADKTK